MKVAGVFGHLTVRPGDPRVAGQGECACRVTLAIGVLEEVPDDFLNPWGVVPESKSVVSLGGNLCDGERLVVGEEIARPDEVGFGGFVVAAVDGVIRALEEPVFAVFL